MLGGFGEQERLAGEGAQSGEAIAARLGERVVGLVCGDVADAGDQREVMGGVCRVGLQPALEELAGLVRGAQLPGDVTLTGARDEAEDDFGLAVENAQVGLVLGEVAVGAVYGGMVNGAITAGFDPGA